MIGNAWPGVKLGSVDEMTDGTLSAVLDARIIMGQDEKALVRLWREKRGEAEPKDLSTNLVVQLGVVTEDLNRHWYERNTGKAVKNIQCRVNHPVIRWMAATLDGVVEGTGAVYEAKFMLPWSFSEEAAAEKHMAQLQHNMWVTNAKTAALSIITGGGKWVEIAIAAEFALPASPPHGRKEVLVVVGEWRSFLACSALEPPRPRIEAVRGRRHDFIQCLGRIRWRVSPEPEMAFLQHENAKTELKGLMPEDAKEASGHGIGPNARNPAP